MVKVLPKNDGRSVGSLQRDDCACCSSHSSPNTFGTLPLPTVLLVVCPGETLSSAGCFKVVPHFTAQLTAIVFYFHYARCLVVAVAVVVIVMVVAIVVVVVTVVVIVITVVVVAILW